MTTTNRFVLHLKIAIKDSTPEGLFTFLRKAVPYYESLGGVRVRLLRSLRDPCRFIEVIEYDDKETFDRDQERVNTDAQMKIFLSEWHELFDETVGVETYQEITNDLRIR